MLPTCASSGPGDLVLPGLHRDMFTLFPTGTDLILVPLVLTLASSEPGDSGSTWTSPVTGDLILSMASPDLVTVVPIGTSPGTHVSGPTWASPDLVSLVPTRVASGYGYTVH